LQSSISIQSLRGGGLCGVDVAFDANFQPSSVSLGSKSHEQAGLFLLKTA